MRRRNGGACLGSRQGHAQKVWTHHPVPLAAEAPSLGRTVTLPPWPPPRARGLQTSQSSPPGHLVPTSSASPSGPHPILAPTRQMSQPLRPRVVSLPHPCLGSSAFLPVLSLPALQDLAHPPGQEQRCGARVASHVPGPGSCTSDEQTLAPGPLPFSVHFLHSGSHPPTAPDASSCSSMCSGEAAGTRRALAPACLLNALWSRLISPGKGCLGCPGKGGSRRGVQVDTAASQRTELW